MIKLLPSNCMMHCLEWLGHWMSENRILKNNLFGWPHQIFGPICCKDKQHADIIVNIWCDEARWREKPGMRVLQTNIAVSNNNRQLPSIVIDFVRESKKWLRKNILPWLQGTSLKEVKSTDKLT